MLGKSIGIVEDDPVAADVLQQFIAEEFELQTHVYIVRDEAGMAKALEGIRDNLDNVVLLDINLGSVSGFDLLVRLNQDPDTKQVWKVMMSGHVFVKKRREARLRHADDIIEKPYNLLEVKAVIDHGLTRFDEIQSHTSTGLPGANRLPQIERQLQKLSIPWAFVSIDWNGLGSLNRKGERVADEALRKFGGILTGVVAGEPIGLRYVGQLGKSDNTFFVCSAGSAVTLAREVESRFQSAIRSVYTEEELKQGFMEAVVIEPDESGDPKESVKKFPLCSLAMGLNSNYYFDGDLSFALSDPSKSARPSTRRRDMPYHWLVRDLSVKARDEAKYLGKKSNQSWLVIHNQSPLAGLSREQYLEAIKGGT